MSEEQLWYYAVGEEKQGPFSVDQLHELVANGTIIPDTQVWTDSLEEWTSASNLEGLFPDKAGLPQGPTLITGAAAQASTPLGATAQGAHLATTQSPSPSLGGSLTGGSHVVGGGMMPPGTEQRLQIRSVGVLQMGLVMMCLAVVMVILYNILAATLFAGLLSLVMAEGGGRPSDMSGMGYAGAGWFITFIVTSILAAILGFFQGVLTAFVYNLAAKMCGGIILRVKAVPNW